jgi:hypothetical protein
MINGEYAYGEQLYDDYDSMKAEIEQHILRLSLQPNAECHGELTVRVRECARV